MPVVEVPSGSGDSKKTTCAADPQESVSASATLRDLVSSSVEDPRDEITELRLQQRQLLQQKKALAKDLKNAQRRTRRVQTRAKTLSDEDLLSVLRMRSARRAVDGGNADTSSKKAKRTEEQSVATEGTEPATGTAAEEAAEPPTSEEQAENRAA